MEPYSPVNSVSKAMNEHCSMDAVTSSSTAAKSAYIQIIPINIATV